MIGLTKLLCGTATVSEAMKYSRSTSDLPPHLLQFSSDARPVVFWNTTHRCNLKCVHCYLSSDENSYPDELSTEEALEFIEDLGEMKVPVLMFSGGEPLIRRDIFQLAERAAAVGLRPVLSTNGVLITKEIAKHIAEVGFQYVGVSLDGGSSTHDKLRRMDGAFHRAVQGIRNCLDAGVKAGVRFTVNKLNYEDLPEIIKVVQEEKVPRFCMYHLVYSGRGREMVNEDLSPQERREVMEWLVAKTRELYQKGVDVEILTTDNHADGIYILREVQRRQPERAKEVVELLKMHGGCSAGVKAANVDPSGNVHPCQFWGHVSLGNVRDRKFSEIWLDQTNDLLVKLREKHRYLRGRCGKCSYKQVCGGCRIRAEVVEGDVWGEDPACYLKDSEILDNRWSVESA